MMYKRFQINVMIIINVFLQVRFVRAIFHLLIFLEETLISFSEVMLLFLIFPVL